MLNRPCLVLLALGLPYTSATVKRQVTELKPSYDFVIAGAGTAGLTVADRLSAAFPDRTVLVVEYGGFNPRPPIFEPVDDWDEAGVFVYNTPVPTLNNRVPRELMVGKTVGGSSATNSQFFDRASRFDYDEWAVFANSSDWSWEGLKPFFRKSVTFVEPSSESVEQYGYTYDVDAAYGGSGPIYSSFPAFQWESTLLSREAWEEVGVAVKEECAGGDKGGLCWMPASQDAWDGSRSHSGIGHWEAVSERANYDLVIKHKVIRVVYSGDSPEDEVPVVEVQSLEDGSIHTITAQAEVIISAGAIHTPQILQRSGIGPIALLEEAGIDVVVELPGVGYNFQDHIGIQFAVNITNEPIPNEGTMATNQTFFQDSVELYELRPAQGPFTLTWGSSAAFVPFEVVTENFKDFAAALREQIASGASASFLPEGADDTLAAGYNDQLALIAEAFENPEQPVLEAWHQGIGDYTALMKPLSRGSILLNTSEPNGEPVINFNTVSNPIELDVLASFLPLFRRFWGSDALAGLGIVETSPGPDVVETDDVKNFLINDGIIQSDYHPCCTASMGPLEKGGVVGPDLRVHGLSKLRVADMSIAPLVPGAHTCATAYAIGEKAADLINQDWS